MLISSLQMADDPDWHYEHNYSPAVARALIKAYDRLRRGMAHTRSYLEAYRDVWRFRDEPQSDRQRMRVFFVIGMGFAAAEEYAVAAEWLEKAMELAGTLHDDGALAELLHARGSAYRAISEFGLAAEDYRLCLELVRQQGEQHGIEDVEIELSTTVQLAGFEYIQAHDQAAEQLLHEAGGIARRAGANGVDVATIEWMWANLEHTRGELGSALQRAIRAADVYTAVLGSSPSTTRVQFLVADIALDLAEASGARPGDGRNAYLTLAGPYAERTMALGRAGFDESGEAMGLLVSARYDRLRGYADHAVRTLEGVVRKAEQIHDITLLVQASVALGREHSARGASSAAMYWYYRAVDEVKDKDFGVLAVPARRAILRYDEMRTRDD
jgi:tetratricopeptide (TPR) repeat protein